MNIAITPQLQEVINLRYPNLTPRQQANRVREDLHKLYLSLYLQANGPQIPFETVPDEPDLHKQVHKVEPSRKIANRVADMAPAIDDQNWAKIERNVRAMQQIGTWDNKTELLLIARLNDEFEGAENEHRVQNSRITAFFDRRISV